MEKKERIPSWSFWTCALVWASDMHAQGLRETCMPRASEGHACSGPQRGMHAQGLCGTCMPRAFARKVLSSVRIMGKCKTWSRYLVMRSLGHWGHALQENWGIQTLSSLLLWFMYDTSTMCFHSDELCCQKLPGGGANYHRLRLPKLWTKSILFLWKLITFWVPFILYSNRKLTNSIAGVQGTEVDGICTAHESTGIPQGPAHKEWGSREVAWALRNRVKDW